MAIRASRLATEWEFCSPAMGEQCLAPMITLPTTGLLRVLAPALEISNYLYLFVCFKQGVSCVAQADLELLSLLPLPAPCLVLKHLYLIYSVCSHQNSGAGDVAQEVKCLPPSPQHQYKKSAMPVYVCNCSPGVGGDWCMPGTH